MKDLVGKKALVTGGGSGIGRAVVRELAGLGAEVAIHYFTSRGPAEALVRELEAQKRPALAVGGDLTREADVRELVARVEERFGCLDVLVNNAGDLVGRQTLEGMPLEFLRRVTAVNVETLMLVTREALPLLKHRPGGSSIVNLSSLAGRKGGHAGALAYSAAKGAILAWTRALSTELAPYGIRVNAVAPGLMLGSRFHAAHSSEESRRETVARIPLGRAGTLEDVARAVAFLASETDGFITGATLDINGGIYMA
ncbi:MAG: SDR family NAD(P)-dependent oxidoreductase [Planctomycetota bacterium]